MDNTDRRVNAKSTLVHYRSQKRLRQESVSRKIVQDLSVTGTEKISLRALTSNLVSFLGHKFKPSHKYRPHILAYRAGTSCVRTDTNQKMNELCSSVGLEVPTGEYNAPKFHCSSCPGYSPDFDCRY